MTHSSALMRTAAVLLLACTALGAQAQHHAAGQRSGGLRWHDGGPGSTRNVVHPGWAVHRPPPRWHGHAVVRPRYGVVIAQPPLFHSLVTVGAIGSPYANGVYYREDAGGGFEVVPPPVDGSSAAAVVAQQCDSRPPDSKPDVHPARAQSGAQQASDEHQCHVWAMSQTGFDPIAAATGQRTSTHPAQR